MTRLYGKPCGQDRICKLNSCAKVFKLTKTNSQLYCSKECTAIHKKLRGRKAVGEPKKCALDICSTMFQPNTGRPDKKFCSRVCSNIAKRGGRLYPEDWRENVVRFRKSEQGKEIASKAGKKSTSLRTKEQYTKIGKTISKAKKGKPNFKLRGEKHHNWKGGISKANRTERNWFMGTLEYKNWRRLVFERDDYRCVGCGIRGAKGVKVVLHADHIKPYASFPEYRLDVDNGRTLCEPRHRATDTWGGRKRNA